MLCSAMIVIKSPAILLNQSSLDRHLAKNRKTATSSCHGLLFRHKNQHTAQWPSTVLIDTTQINASRLPDQTKLIIVVLPSDLTLVTPPLVPSSWYTDKFMALCWSVCFSSPEIPRVLCPTRSSVPRSGCSPNYV